MLKAQYMTLHDALVAVAVSAIKPTLLGSMLLKSAKNANSFSPM